MLLTLFPGGSSVSHVGVIQIGRGWGRVCVSASSPGPSYLSSCIKRSTITELKQLWNLRRLCKLVSAFSITETHTGHVGSTLNNKRKPPCFSLSHTHALWAYPFYTWGTSAWHATNPICVNSRPSACPLCSCCSNNDNSSQGFNKNSDWCWQLSGIYLLDTLS